MLIHYIQKRAQFYRLGLSMAPSSHRGHFNENVQFVISLCRNWRAEEKRNGMKKKKKKGNDNCHNDHDGDVAD